MNIRELAKHIKPYIINEISEITIFSNDCEDWDYLIDSDDVKQNDYVYVFKFNGYNYNIGRTRKLIIQYIQRWFNIGGWK